MTIPTQPLTRLMDIRLEVLDNRRVAAAAILLHHGNRTLGNANHLGLPSHRKHRGMPQAVFRLEGVSFERIVVRNVTIVARGVPGMAAMLPGDILRGHHVTVHACLRIIDQIR